MGASGVAWNENDGALDWLHEYEEHGLTAITRAFDQAIDADQDDSLEVDEGAAVIAAAHYVAAARDGDHTLLEHHPPVSADLANHPDLEELSARATAALARVLDEDASEIFQIWNENDGLFARWIATVDALLARLSS